MEDVEDIKSIRKTMAGEYIRDKASLQELQKQFQDPLKDKAKIFAFTKKKTVLTLP